MEKAFCLLPHSILEDAIHTIDCLTALHDKSTKSFDALTKRQRTSVLKVFAYLESNPIIEIDELKKAK